MENKQENGMDHRVLEIPIQCGDTTCASEPGKFCPQLRTARFGSTFTCKLFSEQEYKEKWEELPEKNGWIQRHPDCVKMERKEDSRE